MSEMKTAAKSLAEVDYAHLQEKAYLNMGPFSKVYLVNCRGQEYAFKQFIITETNSNLIENAVNETQAIDGLFNVRVVGKVQNPPGILLEYMNSGSLKKVIEQQEAKLRTKKQILLDVAYGIEALHKQNLAHRNIKPSNILLHRNGEALYAKLSDMGTQATFEMTMESALGGPKSPAFSSLYYMAPEMISVLAKEVDDNKLDIYSFSIVAYELLTGLRPFKGEASKSFQEFGCAVLAAQRPAFSGQEPKDWVSMIEKCWDQDPEKRPTAAELIEMIKNLSEDECSPSPLPECDNNTTESSPESTTATTTTTTSTRPTSIGDRGASILLNDDFVKIEHEVVTCVPPLPLPQRRIKLEEKLARAGKITPHNFNVDTLVDEQACFDRICEMIEAADRKEFSISLVIRDGQTNSLMAAAIKQIIIMTTNHKDFPAILFPISLCVSGVIIDFSPEHLVELKQTWEVDAVFSVHLGRYDTNVVKKVCHKVVEYNVSKQYSAFDCNSRHFVIDVFQYTGIDKRLSLTLIDSIKDKVQSLRSVQKLVVDFQIKGKCFTKEGEQILQEVTGCKGKVFQVKTHAALDEFLYKLKAHRRYGKVKEEFRRITFLAACYDRAYWLQYYRNAIGKNWACDVSEECSQGCFFGDPAFREFDSAVLRKQMAMFKEKLSARQAKAEPSEYF